jgi:hypothetical protein
MSYRIIWNFPALQVFNSLPIHSATVLDRAVIRFAEKGEGELEWDPPNTASAQASTTRSSRSMCRRAP